MYSKHEAESYQLTKDIGTELSDVEKSVHRWLKSGLDNGLPKTGLVADVGCGSGRLLPWLRGPERSIVGIDASKDMLKLIKPIGHEKFIHSDLNSGLKHLAEQGLRVDAALSSFVMVCFPKPQTLIRAIEDILCPGGKAWITTNVFVPKKSSQNELPTSLRFKHKLNLPTGSVLLHDYVHSLNQVMHSLDPHVWKILDCQTFPAEGCEHIEAEGCFSPQEPWTYLKAGIALRLL